jgi:hypothetical protein
MYSIVKLFDVLPAAVRETNAGPAWALLGTRNTTTLACADTVEGITADALTVTEAPFAKCTLTATALASVTSGNFETVILASCVPESYTVDGDREVISGSRSSMYVKKKEALFQGAKVGYNTTFLMPGLPLGTVMVKTVAAESLCTRRVAVTLSSPHMM